MSQHVCARCPRVLTASCCEVDEDEQLATLTPADVARVAEHTGWRAEKFSEQEWLTPEEAAAYERRRPLYVGYFRRSTARLTLRRAQGACVFLDRARGCTLPSDVRPTACRLYPFELWPDGQWSLQVARFGDLDEAAAQRGAACLAVEEAEGMDDVLRAFSLTREQVEAIGAQLREEVRAAAGTGSADPRRRSR